MEKRYIFEFGLSPGWTLFLFPWAVHWFWSSHIYLASPLSWLMWTTPVSVLPHIYILTHNFNNGTFKIKGFTKTSVYCSVFLSLLKMPFFSFSLFPRLTQTLVSLSCVQGLYKGATRVILATENDYCKLCDASFSSPAVAQAHYQGKNHAKKLRLAEVQSNSTNK